MIGCAKRMARALLFRGSDYSPRIPSRSRTARTMHGCAHMTCDARAVRLKLAMQRASSCSQCVSNLARLQVSSAAALSCAPVALTPALPGPVPCGPRCGPLVSCDSSGKHIAAPPTAHSRPPAQCRRHSRRLGGSGVGAPGRSHRCTRRDRLRHDHYQCRRRRTLLGEETLKAKNAFR